MSSKRETNSFTNKITIVGAVCAALMDWRSRPAIIICLIFWAITAPASAVITTTGNVVPDPNTTTSANNLYVGANADGTMTVDAGSGVISGTGHIGDDSGVNGTATITGAGSTWNNSLTLYVGNKGIGTLNIENGGAVSNATSYLGFWYNSTGTVTVTGAGSTWNNSDNLIIGRYALGTLNIENGGVVSSTTGYVSFSGGSTGTATVAGIGSTWNNSGNLSVGRYGVLNIENGGVVSSQDGYLGSYIGFTGTATVTGTGSMWNNSRELYVGRSGTGTLNIESGGAVNVVNDAYVNDLPTGSSINFDGGTLNTGGLAAAPSDLLGVGVINTTGMVSDIDLAFDQNNALQQQFVFNSEPGQNITLNLDQAFVGDARGILGAGYRVTGSLTVADGKTVRSTEGYLGYHIGSTGTATVTGSGSTWNNRSSMYVGKEGTGTLNIENGGVVASRDSYVGNDAGSTGTATVTGTGSTWNTMLYLYVGGTGTGTLNIENGGAVSNTNGRIGTGTGSTGTVNVTGAGSTWNNSGSLTVGSGGTGGTGTLNIENGGAVSNTTGSIDSGSTTTVAGADSMWNNSGNLTVQGNGTLNIHSGGSVVVGGNLTLINSTSTTLDIILGSFSDPLLDVAGDVWLNGSLNVGLAGGFALNDGDLFTLIDLTGIGSTLTGTFTGFAEGANVGNLGGLNLLISYAGGDGNDVTLSATAVHWLPNASGNWDTPSNWTFAALPSAADTVYIDPLNGLEVTGPSTSHTVHNLTIGTTVSGVASLVQGSGQINVNNAITIESRGELQVASVVSAGAGIFNSGVITGQGQLDGQLVNQANGEVRVASGDVLRFTAAGNTNAGRIEVIGGGIEFNQGLLNDNTISPGTIVARNATLRFGGAGLLNDSSVGFSIGISDVFGDVVNNGAVTITGNSTVTFWDDFTNNGATTVLSGSTAVFFGLSGTGIGGGGDIFIEGDLRPGFSPGEVAFGGSVYMGLLAGLNIELGGTVAGSEYDRLTVADLLALDGTLNVDLIGLFDPQAGDVFDILDWGSLSGTFSSMNLPSLGYGLSWDTSQLYTSGRLGTIPEPGTFAAVMSLGVMLLVRRRQSGG